MFTFLCLHYTWKQFSRWNCVNRTAWCRGTTAKTSLQPSVSGGRNFTSVGCAAWIFFLILTKTHWWVTQDMSSDFHGILACCPWRGPQSPATLYLSSPVFSFFLSFPQNLLCQLLFFLFLLLSLSSTHTLSIQQSLTFFRRVKKRNFFVNRSKLKKN